MAFLVLGSTQHTCCRRFCHNTLFGRGCRVLANRCHILPEDPVREAQQTYIHTHRVGEVQWVVLLRFGVHNLDWHDLLNSSTSQEKGSRCTPPSVSWLNPNVPTVHWTCIEKNQTSKFQECNHNLSIPFTPPIQLWSSKGEGIQPISATKAE